jgi:hypothetical protein
MFSSLEINPGVATYLLSICEKEEGVRKQREECN